MPTSGGHSTHHEGRASPSTEDLTARLSKLKTLLEQDLITEEDFEAQKRRLLNEI